MIFDQLINPIVATIFSFFGHTNSGRFGCGLRAVQGVVDSIACAFRSPFSSRVFKSNKEPRAAAFHIGIRHVVTLVTFGQKQAR